MHEIRIHLNNAASLGPLAAPALGGAAALPPGMPGAPGGVYLILNTPTVTRYAGISTNIVTRFNGRMAVVNELGMGTATMAPIWAWWGQVSIRRFPPPANFATAFPTALAGFPLATRYALPPGGVTPCPAPLPAILGMPAPHVTAFNDATLPIRCAVGAYQAWAAIPFPKTVLAFNPAFTGAVGFAPSPAVATAAVAQGTAQAAAAQAATAAGAPMLVAIAASVAIAAFAAGWAPPPSDVAAVVHTYYGGPPLAAPPAPTAFVVQNPAAGPPTTLTGVLPGVGAVNLEQVFIRYILNYLGAGGFVANGALIAPMAWPGGIEPICVTWHSCAGSIFPAFDHSVIWWPGGAF